jgi:hypothetical protein
MLAQEKICGAGAMQKFWLLFAVALSQPASYKRLGRGLCRGEGGKNWEHPWQPVPSHCYSGTVGYDACFTACTADTACSGVQVQEYETPGCTYYIVGKSVCPAGYEFTKGTAERSVASAEDNGPGQECFSMSTRKFSVADEL